MAAIAIATLRIWLQNRKVISIDPLKSQTRLRAELFETLDSLTKFKYPALFPTADRNLLVTIDNKRQTKVAQFLLKESVSN